MYLGSLATQLNNGEMTVPLRTLCALLVKKSLESKDPDVKVAKREAYTSIESAAREEIKRLLLSALFSEQRDVSRGASQAVAKIAVIELPAGAWPDLIPGLLAKMTTEGTLDHVKEATLLTLGYICDEIETGVLKKDSDLILTAITQGMCAAESAERYVHPPAVRPAPREQQVTSPDEQPNAFPPTAHFDSCGQCGFYCLRTSLALAARPCRTASSTSPLTRCRPPTFQCPIRGDQGPVERARLCRRQHAGEGRARRADAGHLRDDDVQDGEDPCCGV